MTADLSPHDARLTEQSLDTARRLFSRHGVRGIDMATLVREITRETGANLLELRRAYPTRMDLVYAVVLRSTRTLVTAQLGDSGAPDDPVGRLSRLIRRHIDFCWDHWTEEGLRRDLLPRLRTIHPTRYRELYDHMRSYHEHICGIITQGNSQGSFRVVSPGAAAETVLETLDSILNWYEPEGGLTLPQLADVYVDLIVHHQLGCPRE
ncbi:AcrR family transcriptional regulator [Lipingzhangella halophila]|uniref:AcrR family transcriptional regulator n=1 Tax=Lipingzhangella halophila TaxID=1783352 RepID=A0A7W7RJ92_9ACTN|nr:TetR/AcrR family transcriptional regulator [Lipingzhangella halophila]MBB4932603.1 AcrR family transcriptional regulator [Lipingzhangella halophila]